MSGTIRPAGRKLDIGWVNWQVLGRSCHLVKDGGDRSSRSAAFNAAFSVYDDGEAYKLDLAESQLRTADKLSSLVQYNGISCNGTTGISEVD